MEEEELKEDLDGKDRKEDGTWEEEAAMVKWDRTW
jgi:hypothetical protein